MDALKVTISGSYKAHNGDVIDFDDLVGFCPMVSQEKCEQHVRGRYVFDWLAVAVDDEGKRKYPIKVDTMRQVFVDEIMKLKADFNYIGKNIKEMSYDELQDLAVANDLMRVPLPKSQSGISLREIRQIAYLEYSKHVLGSEIDNNHEDYNYAELPELIVGGQITVTKDEHMSNDEIIEAEGSHLTLDELKVIADAKGMKYHHNIGANKLYNLIYG